MTTQAAAIHKFLSGFGVPAYSASSVPVDAEFPYLTYSLVTGEWGDGEQPMAVSLWYRTESESKPNAKAEEIRRSIGRGGRVLRCDGGAVWVKRGVPWCQSMSDPDDDMVKRRYINLDLEYMITD